MALIVQTIRAFGIISKTGFSSPHQVEIFSVSNTSTLSKEILLWVENECCCSPTINVADVNFTTKISITPDPVFKNMGQQISGPDSSNGYSIQHQSEGWVRVPLRSRRVLSKKLRYFLKNIRSWVENDPGAHFAFQMLTLLQKYPIQRCCQATCLINFIRH